MHGSRHLTKTGAISTGLAGWWECYCGKRYKSRQGFRRHLQNALDTPARGCYCTSTQAIPTKGSIMTKREFEMIASVFSDHEARHEDNPAGGGELIALKRLQRDLADEIERTHPRFQRGRFDVACFPIQADRLKKSAVERLRHYSDERRTEV